MKASDVAKFILKHSEKGLSNLELQKMLYFVQKAHYREHDSPLIDDDFEAWRFGPVIRNVYLAYCCKGADSIVLDASEKVCLALDEAETRSVIETIRACNLKGYWRLVDESHHEGGAWHESYMLGDKHTISKALIQKEACEE